MADKLSTDPSDMVDTYMHDWTRGRVISRGADGPAVYEGRLAFPPTDPWVIVTPDPEPDGHGGTHQPAPAAIPIAQIVELCPTEVEVSEDWGF